MIRHNNSLRMSAQLLHPKRESFLGLPTELRFEIYGHVVSTELDCVIVKLWLHEFIYDQGQGYRCSPRRTSVNLREHLPWTNLKLVCKLVAAELGLFMAGPAPTHDRSTYALRLITCKSGSILGRTTWNQIPCPPSQARIVSITYDCSYALHGIGLEGPMGIVRGLCQLLKLLVHCGPSFNPQRVLAQPMQIEQVQIRVEPPAQRRSAPVFYELRGSIGGCADPLRTFRQLAQIVSMVVQTGVTGRFVKTFNLSWGSREKHWTVSPQCSTGIPAEWDDCVFGWDLDKYSEA